ncbi:MAG: 2-dehydropantoate 2-reductase [Thermoplasmata archaeon]
MRLVHLEVYVFGAGSLGCAIGGILARKHTVTLIGRRPLVEAVRRKGLVMRGDIRRVVPLRAFTDLKGLESPRLIIVTTKAYDTAVAAESCADIADKDTMVLTLQNGLGNAELLRERFGRRAFAGSTTMGAAMLSPGVVKVSGLGRTIIGADMDRAGARVIARAFAECGIRASTTFNSAGVIWEKAIVNACMNPITAVLRVRNGVLVENPVVRRLMMAVCDECVQVALAEGVRLPSRDVRARVRWVCRETAGNLSSMLQDVMRGKRTEIREITGAICSRGDRHGIETPLNRALLAMVESLELAHRPGKG